MSKVDLWATVSHHLLPNSSHTVTVSHSLMICSLHLYEKKPLSSIFQKSKQWIPGELTEYISQNEMIDFLKRAMEFPK